MAASQASCATLECRNLTFKPRETRAGVIRVSISMIDRSEAVVLELEHLSEAAAVLRQEVARIQQCILRVPHMITQLCCSLVSCCGHSAVGEPVAVTQQDSLQKSVVLPYLQPASTAHWRACSVLSAALRCNTAAAAY